MAQQYLSTDPNAGAPARGSDYISTDPNAGQPLRVKSKAQQIASEAAPTVGGMVGGMVGGIPGAAIGGAAGQGIGTLIDKGAEIPGALVDVARNLVNEPVATIKGFHEGIAQGGIDTAQAAGIEGATQFVGNKVVDAGGVLAKWLMNRATTRVTEKLLREFPDFSDTLIDNALTVSKGGYEKAKGLLAAAKAKTKVVLTQADQSGATVPIQMTPELAESFKTALLEDAIRARGIPASQGAVTAASSRLPAHLRSVFQQIDSAAQNGGAMDVLPSQADLLKRRLQLESKPTYAQRGAPNGPRAMGMESAERAELASQINAAIETVAQGYKATNAEAQPLIGAVRGLRQAVRPSGNLYQAMVRPGMGALTGGALGYSQDGSAGAAVGAMAGAALTSPAGMSREAILLSDPKVQELLRQLPRGMVTALTAALRQRSGAPAETPPPQE
jgi:hypothetical protein